MSLAAPETPAEKLYAATFSEGYDAGWAAAIEALLGDQPPERFQAMLDAAAQHRPVYENRSYEIAPFKIMKAMVRAFAENRS